MILIAVKKVKITILVLKVVDSHFILIRDNYDINVIYNIVFIFVEGEDDPGNLPPSFSIYELRNKLFSGYPPRTVHAFTYKFKVKTHRPPLHWVSRITTQSIHCHLNIH